MEVFSREDFLQHDVVEGEDTPWMSEAEEECPLCGNKLIIWQVNTYGDCGFEACCGKPIGVKPATFCPECDLFINAPVYVVMSSNGRLKEYPEEFRIFRPSEYWKDEGPRERAFQARARN